MIELTNAKDVKNIQSCLRVCLGTPQGAEVIKFLEQICGWYDFYETDKDKILIAHGKRQVLAMIKTLLELQPEQIVAIAQRENV